MVFSSITFLLLFLPVVLLGYFLLYLATSRGMAARGRTLVLNLWILAASVLFYVWGERYLALVMLTTVLTDFLCALIIAGGLRGPITAPLPKDAPREPWQRRVLIASIGINLALLAFFKYFNFGLANLRAGATALGLANHDWMAAVAVTLPLGISFYTFQSMSYTIDVYRGDVKATRNFIDFACMVTLFPHLVAGPILRYRQMESRLHDRRVRLDEFASGVTRFVVGLGKKTLIANSIAGPVDKIFALPADQLTTATAWIGVIGYALQIYFDFSGYSDMAIGLGRMFGFNIPENFNYPYAATSMTDFWRRWHISLSTWFRDYLYVPLGGNRESEAITYRNLLVVFFLCGLWHGAQWTFVLWGLFHGAFLIVERLGLSRQLARLPLPVRHAYALAVVLFGWTLFRADSVAHASRFMIAMASGGASGGLAPAAIYLDTLVWIALSAGVILSAPIVPALARSWEQLHARSAGGWAVLVEGAGQSVRVGVTAALLVASLMSLASGTYNPFIYYRF